MGYGNLAPNGTASNVVAAFEAMVGLMGFAVATGTSLRTDIETIRKNRIQRKDARRAISEAERAFNFESSTFGRTC